MNQKKHVKESFESAANEYENIIPKIIPFYHEQDQIILSFLTSLKNKNIRVLDLGVGTGRLSRLILENFPLAMVEGIDIAENMVKTSQKNLFAYKNRYTSQCLDFAEWQAEVNKYDLILAGLSIHHLNDTEKQNLFDKIYTSLKPEGLFVLRELVRANSELASLMCLDKWIEFMDSHKMDSANVLRNHREHDIPATVEDQLNWLKNSGFSQTNYPWHYLNFAIIIAEK